jgi:sugar lactone lactonase YvrE
MDSSGNVYVSDIGNDRIQKFSSTGSFLTAWGSSGTGNGQFQSPSGIAVGPLGKVYVADESRSDRVQEFSSTGDYITQWGSYGTGNGQFASPEGVAADSSGNVYVADYSNNRIQKFSSTGSFLMAWGSSGSGNGQLQGPSGVAVDSSGYVYVADSLNNRIQKFDSVGNFLTKWGSQGSGNGQFKLPFAIAVDSSGYVYVTDNYNYRIQKFDSAGNFVTKWGTQGSGNGKFQSPSGVAVDSSGYVYVADYVNNCIQVFSPPCSYTLSTKSIGCCSASSSGTITVIPVYPGSPGSIWPSCSWTASTGDPWITFTGSTSGKGSGTVNYTVAANATGSGWTGTIGIGGKQGSQAFTIRQAAGIFSDVVSTSAFGPYIYSIYKEGITKGCGTGLYCPTSNVTRGEMAAFIIRSIYREDFSHTTTAHFIDVPANSAFFKYVQKMKDLGYTAVTETYDVNGAVTRGQMAAFIIRSIYGENFSYTTAPYFTDVPSSNTFFKYVQKMKDLGYTAVTGTYEVNSLVTREQMAAFLSRAYLGMH